MNNTAELTINDKINLHVPIGTLLSDALVLHGAQQVDNFNLALPPMPCGGIKKCVKCRVKASGNLSKMCEDEKNALSQQELNDNIRLACFCTVLGDCKIILNDAIKSKIKSDGILPEFEKEPLFENYGIAFDIGTTTLAAHLYSKETLLSKTTSANPQVQYGADVITRISYALESEQNTKEIANCLKNKMNDMLQILCDNASISALQVDFAVIVGNTTMLYLLNERNAYCLSRAPFEADFLFDDNASAKELGLIIQNAKIYFPPCISAFVGADITCSVLASDMCKHDSTNLLVDIGTNGEIALWQNNNLLCCSTAAGPACEGSGIKMGMNGGTGVIDHVFVNDGEISAHVIGETNAIGICGSGVIDAISCLLNVEEIDETGFMENDEAIILQPVIITQKDVRLIQLAKSAICAGIETMLEEKNLNFDDLENFYVAGGFGSYLNIESAAHIGLVPKAAPKKAKVLGNAALMGACAILLSKQMQQNALQIVKKAKAIDLSTSSIFTDKYTNGMFFDV